MSSKREVKKVLVVDPNAEQSARLSHQLEFIEYDTKILSSPELVDSLPEIAEFQAVLVSNFHGIVDWVGRLKEKHEGCPPFVLLLGNQPADISQKEIEDNFIGCLKDDIRYANLSDILHRAEVRGSANTEVTKEGTQNPELFRSLVGNSRAIVRGRYSQ